MDLDPFLGIDFATLPDPEPFAFDAEAAVFASSRDGKRLVEQVLALGRQNPARFRHALAEAATHTGVPSRRVLRQDRGRWVYVNPNYAWCALVPTAFGRAVDAGHPEAVAAQVLISLASWARALEEQRVRQEKRKAAGRKGALARKAKALVDRKLG